MAFGLQIPEYQVQVSLNNLIAGDRLKQSADSNLVLPNGTRAQLKQRIDEAKTLEESVKQVWLENISKRFAENQYGSVHTRIISAQQL